MILVGIGVVLTAAACTSPMVRYNASRSSTPDIPTSVPRPTTSQPSAPPSTTTSTTELEQPGWTPVSYVGPSIAVDERSFTYADGAQVTVARFRAGQTQFDLHVGSQDPPTSLTALPPQAQPSVSSGEAPWLVAAFNGGFKVSAGAGGFEVDGQTLVPLVNGSASFVIDTNGTGHVGVWGQSLPAPGEQVASVRQNLVPLVSASAPSSEISNISAWGATLGGGAMVARSALGEDGSGNILYAGSMSGLPLDLASALISSGANTAMELDINPEWIQLALAPSPGAALGVGVPGQNRPADQVQVGWTRDFVTVLAIP